jgi:hypothetical protein
LAGLVLLVGTMALPKTKRDLTLWTHSGLGMMLVTGSVMFLADTARYVRNPAFLAKMILLVPTLAWQFSLRNRGPGGRMIAVLLWTLVALTGRGIADFDL